MDKSSSETIKPSTITCVQIMPSRIENSRAKAKLATFVPSYGHWSFVYSPCDNNAPPAIALMSSERIELSSLWQWDALNVHTTLIIPIRVPFSQFTTVLFWYFVTTAFGSPSIECNNILYHENIIEMIYRVNCRLATVSLLKYFIFPLFRSMQCFAYMDVTV